MTKPKLPSGGGSFIREKNGALTKREDQPVKKPAEETTKPAAKAEPQPKEA